MDFQHFIQFLECFRKIGIPFKELSGIIDLKNLLNMHQQTDIIFQQMFIQH